MSENIVSFTENEDNLNAILIANEDSSGEPIFSMPTIEPLREQQENYYYSNFTKSFSLSKGVQTKISEFIDRPKWNEITLMAQIHEALAYNLDTLRSEEVRQHVTQFKEWDELVQGEQLRHIKSCIGLSHHIKDINASLFFTLLFVDHELNSKLDIGRKLVIANALTFATWKERMECDLLRNTQWGDVFRGKMIYRVDKAQHTQAFVDFCGDRTISQPAISDRRRMIEISPWAGLDAVMQVIDYDEYMHSLAKRQMEDQWILLEVITNLPPNVPQLQRIKDEIEQLLHNNMVVDTHGRLDLYTKRGLEFIQSVKENPKVHEQMQKVSEEFQESASTALAGILSKTGKKLLHSYNVSSSESLALLACLVKTKQLDPASKTQQNTSGCFA